jgi:hypothetical protein
MGKTGDKNVYIKDAQLAKLYEVFNNNPKNWSENLANSDSLKTILFNASFVRQPQLKTNPFGKRI